LRTGGSDGLGEPACHGSVEVETKISMPERLPAAHTQSVPAQRRLRLPRSGRIPPPTGNVLKDSVFRNHPGAPALFDVLGKTVQPRLTIVGRELDATGTLVHDRNNVLNRAHTWARITT
jgi:hypothetical protein